ncbi:Ig-like domain-containing protein, partial [Acinetobacter sp. CFCC 10889]|uniref:Ig-like domain-containing protein n=1 Tax=Acinetobacter sp. CFCC 10889 TaxID=1775557 RepID=UPI001D18F1F0
PSEDGLTWTGKVPDNTQGQITVTVPEGSYGDTSGNPGTGGTDTELVDTTAPTLEITLNPDGTVLFTFSEEVKGFTSNDILVNGANLVAGSLVDLGDGIWTAKLDKMPKDGTTVTVEVKDNTYTDLTDNLGKGDIDQEIHIKVNTVTPNPATGGTTITGKTEPNNTVEVTVPGYDKPFIVTADPEGNWVVETDGPIKDGNSITATTPDQDGNPVEDQIQLPYVSIDVIAGDDILDPSELAEIKTGTTFTVTGTISNPNADMTITFNGKTYSGSQVTINTDGTWSIQVPVEDIRSQNTVTAQATAT